VNTVTAAGVLTAAAWKSCLSATRLARRRLATLSATTDTPRDIR
jgi:hypothetical protein